MDENSRSHHLHRHFHLNRIPYTSKTINKQQKKSKQYEISKWCAIKTLVIRIVLWKIVLNRLLSHPMPHVFILQLNKIYEEELTNYRCRFPDDFDRNRKVREKWWFRWEFSTLFEMGGEATVEHRRIASIVWQYPTKILYCCTSIYSCYYCVSDITFTRQTCVNLYFAFIQLPIYNLQGDLSLLLCVVFNYISL